MNKKLLINLADKPSIWAKSGLADVKEEQRNPFDALSDDDKTKIETIRKTNESHILILCECNKSEEYIAQLKFKSNGNLIKLSAGLNIIKESEYPDIKNGFEFKIVDDANDDASILAIDLSHYNSSAVSDMSLMFYGLQALKYLNLSDLDTSKVTNMAGMFRMVTDLKYLDLSSFDTSNVTDMSGMFFGVDLPILDLSGFNMGKVRNLEGMLECSTTLLDISGWQIADGVEGCINPDDPSDAWKVIILQNVNDNTYNIVEDSLGDDFNGIIIE